MSTHDRARNHRRQRAGIQYGETGVQITTDALQKFGGYGYTEAYAVEKWTRDAKFHQIYAGTSRIRRWVIARQLLA